MPEIRDTDELRRIHSAGRGFIYNDFAGNGQSGVEFNILHEAGCPTLDIATETSIPWAGVENDRIWPFERLKWETPA